MIFGLSPCDKFAGDVINLLVVQHRLVKVVMTEKIPVTLLDCTHVIMEHRKLTTKIVKM
jgi:hypothetical protein